MSKKMNLSALKSQEVKTFTQKKVVCGQYTVLVDEVFRESKIVDLMKYFLEKTNYMNENGMNIPNDTYAWVLILKFFTDIEMSDDINEQIKGVNSLYDLGYFDIIAESFNQKEIDKITLRMSNFIKIAIDELKSNEDVNESGLIDDALIVSAENLLKNATDNFIKDAE